ncbi:MAG TPA: substrate-binding domain-containing protein [Solirubrobacteraceae bacterium]|nr:substrate-binding domain-containing protein [Solirubrobacteraceae bacterium]
MAPAIGQASFSSPYTTQCSGSSVLGIVTTLQTNIDAKWSAQFGETAATSPLACTGRGIEVGFESGSNPEALNALGATSGVRNAEYSFAGNEEPPSLGEWLSIDLGNEPGHNSGLIRQIPVATTAIAPIVTFPAGCALPEKEATGDGRFTVSNASLEKVYAGEIVTWGELLPDIETACASTPIKRVVPNSSEGTSFVFKQWLNTVNKSRGWTSLGNAEWPNDSGVSATVRAPFGDRSEAQTVAETNGAIGFASLPNARSEGFGVFSPENTHHNNSGRFWLSVTNGASERVEPTRDPHSGANNVKGANCDNPTFNYVPSGYDTTATPIWRSVSAAGSKTGWPICTLTYALAWDDASTVYGNTETREAMQRTVKDYLAFVLGTEGQEEAENRDYSKLPSGLLADAQDGQSRVGWKKIPGSKEEVQAAVKVEISADETHRNP